MGLHPLSTTYDKSDFNCKLNKEENTKDFISSITMLFEIEAQSTLPIHYRKPIHQIREMDGTLLLLGQPCLHTSRERVLSLD